MLIGDAPQALVPFPVSFESAQDISLTPATRIIANDAALATARLLAADFATRTGVTLEVATGEATVGDIALTTRGEGTSEAYALATADGIVRLDAEAEVGLYLATRTLLQLATERDGGWAIAGATISDAPRFDFRGVMLDVARHFFTVEEVCRYIDLVSTLKINSLHLHLTDDQGWRIEIDGFPKLTERAAESASLGDRGGFFTQSDYTRIVEHAATRHMTVIPEIDMPGHTHAVTVAYPEFAAPTADVPSVAETAAALGQDLPVFGEPYPGWGVGFSSLKIGDDATNAFVAEVFRQLAAITPGPWLHMGGDESLGTPDEDFATFVRDATAAAAATGKTPIAWHEAGKVSGLPQGTVGQYWGYLEPQPGYAEEGLAFARNGGAVILSPADVAYLDMKPTPDHPIGLAWAKGATSVEAATTWEPSEIIDGLDEASVLGIEAPMWTESIRTFADVEQMAFPRLAGIADIAWSPQGAPTRSWESIRERIAGLAPAWQAYGVNFFQSDEIDWQA